MAPELPGYGESTGEDLLEDMLDFTLHGWDVVDALGLDRPHLIGHSMGGMIAAEMACLAPRDLGKLVLASAAGLWIDEHPIPDVFALLPFELVEVLFHDPARGSALLTGGLDLADMNALKTFYLANARRMAMAGKILFPVPNRRVTKRLYRLTAQTLVLWGERDALIPPVYAERWGQLIPGARVERIGDAGHMLPWEAPDPSPTPSRGFSADRNRRAVIFLIRHGETHGNAARIVQVPDIPLSPRGIVQAERLARRLEGEGIGRIVASDLARARMTAEHLHQATGAPLMFDPLLHERSFGDLRGTPYADLGFDMFAPDYAPPNGESWEVFHARVDRAWGRVLGAAAATDGHLAVVTHGLVCRSLAARHLLLPAGAEVPERWENTGVTIVDGHIAMAGLADELHRPPGRAGRRPRGERGGRMTPAARLRVGVLGLSHDHVWANLRSVAEGELGTLTAVAEPDALLRARLGREHGGVAVLATYEALLERTDLDAVLLFADNRASAEWGVRALGRGLPVMVEKPMAADVGGADALLGAARAAGLPLMVNWPTVWRPALRHGLALVAGGAIGEPVQLSHRGGHAGPREFGCSPQFCDWLYDGARNGGGALVDYCGYGGILARTVLGRPASVTAVAAHLRKAGLDVRGQCRGRAPLSAGAGPARGLLDPDRRGARLRTHRVRRHGHADRPPAAPRPRGRHGGPGPRAGRDIPDDRDGGAARPARATSGTA